MDRIEPPTAPDAGARPSVEEDRALVARARDQDRGAMRAIYERHRRGVGQHLLHLLHDRAAVDDLVQETFVLAFSQLQRYDGSARLSTWLHGIALNLARNHRAKERRRGLLLAAHGADGGPANTPAGADAGARAQQALDLLYHALDELAPEQREAFVVRVIERRPLKEAAGILGAPVATVSYRARQAEAHVRAFLRAREIEA